MVCKDGFVRLLVLYLLGFSLVLCYVAAVPTTGSLKSIEEAYQSADDQEFLAHQDATDLADKSDQLLNAGEGWHIRRRMATDDTTNDYPPTGANPAHRPKTPPGAN